MEQINQNQFSDISNGVENELQKGSIILMNQIKNYNTLDKKIASIKSLNLKDDIEYMQVINGILNGMLFDNNVSLDNYFQFLFSVNRDSYKTFVIKLADVISYARLKKEKFNKIYQIYEKLLSIYYDKNDLVELMILICRKFYPGQELLNSIIYDNNSDDDFIQKNSFYNFLNFIKNHLEFILENDKVVNLPGIIFIKIFRLLTETHIYHQNLNNSGNNFNEKTNTIITNIINTYQKINFNEKTKKLISEIYDTQILILTKIYTERKKNVLSIGRELIRHLISMSNSNIEIINIIKEDININYENILSISNSANGYNVFTIINIPPLMERMITYILTSVKRGSSTYNIYINWLFHEYKIENSIGNTLLVDITRFIMTNNFYYQKYQYDEDYVPRWLMLGYLLKHIKNHIISSEIKQTIFLDLILFDKTKDGYYLIEPSLSCIIINLKDYPTISEELIEFLEHYIKHFDDKNLQKRINSVCDAFHIFEQKNRNNNDCEKLIRNCGMEERFKNSFINLIKNENWLKQNEINSNINYNNTSIKTEEKNKDNIKDNNNNLNDNKMNIEIDILKDNKKVNSNLIQNKNKEIQKNNNNQSSKQERNKEVPKKVNIDIIIPKEMYTYTSMYNIKSFVSERSQKKFSSILNDLCKYNSKTFGDNIDNKVKKLDSSYNNLCTNFAKFYIKIFKDELELKAFENYEDFNFNNNTYLYSYLLDYAYDKIVDNSAFQFISDLINKIIEIYPLFIIHLISYILNNNYQVNKFKNNIDYISFFFLLNDDDINLLKQKLKLFLVQCEENFLYNPLKFFFFREGINLFQKVIIDDEHLILKIIKNCDLVSINAINMSIMNNKYILIDKKFFILFKYSILFSPLEKNIFWNLIFSQGKIPSINLEQFLINSINIIRNPPIYKGETTSIDYNEFIGNIIKSIKILFKNEIMNEINNGDIGLDSLSGKFSLIFEFDSGLKIYAFILIDNILEYYFDNKNKKKMFSLIVQKYYTNNSKNIGNLRIMIEFIYFFMAECKKRYFGDKNNNNSWISEDIKTIINEITKIINKFNNSEMQK